MSSNDPPVPDLDLALAALRDLAETGKQWSGLRLDLRALLAAYDSQVTRLAAAERFHDLGAHTAACQQGLGYGGCEPTCSHLRTIINGAAGMGRVNTTRALLRVYVRIAPPRVGLYYSAVCGHGSSDMHFDATEVEALTGIEKVCRLATTHRQRTGCVCLAEDEVYHVG